MRIWLWYLGAVFSVWLTSALLASLMPPDLRVVSTLLYALPVFVAGLGALAVRRHRERVSRSAAEESVERLIAERAAARTFVVALISMVGFGTYLALRDNFVDALVLYGLLWVIVGAYWLRYAIERHDLT